MTRATVAERTFSSQGGYTVVPDEESKKLIINQAVERDGETFFICHKCDDLTSFHNAKDINIKEMGQCMHSKLPSILFPSMLITDLDNGNTNKNNLDPFAHSGKKSNVFGISINYPPDESEEEAIKCVNHEDVFPGKSLLQLLKLRKSVNMVTSFLMNCCQQILRAQICRYTTQQIQRIHEEVHWC